MYAPLTSSVPPPRTLGPSNTTCRWVVSYVSSYRSSSRILMISAALTYARIISAGEPRLPVKC